jgi:hypothetical protein
LEGNRLRRDEIELADPWLVPQSHGRSAKIHECDAPSGAMAAAHDFEQSVVWSSRVADSAVLRNPCNVGEDETVVQLAGSPGSDDLDRC